MTVTIEAIADIENLMQATKKVVSNKGAAGVDGMRVSELKEYMKVNAGTLKEAIIQGKYRPQPVKRVWIPKDNGKKRGLGIPTAIDRVVQQAVANVLGKEYDPTFSDQSNGFRPERGAHTALHKVIDMANDGYTWVVEMDLAKFFDTVPHQRLIGKLASRIKDGRVVSLIHRIMRAEVSDEGKLEPTTIGVPQGGPLSPILANIYLDELDKLLEKRGHQFVRYADDMMVLTRSERSARRTLENIIKYAEGVMKLTVNREKSGVYPITNGRVKFLGHGFYRDWKNERIILTVHSKNRHRIKERVKEILKRNRSKSVEDVKLELASYIRGTVAYFRYALRTGTNWARDMDAWMRRRIRQLIWKAWKTPRKRLYCLRKLGVTGDSLYTAMTRKGYWRTATTPALHQALSNVRLEGRGWMWMGTLLKQQTLF